MRLPIRLSLTVALAAVALTPAHVAACSCAGTTPTAALEQADVAFIGVVVDFVDTNPLYPMTYSTGDEIQYAVVVEERIKGDPPDLTVVRSLRDGASCGLGMSVGDRWRLYGHRQDLHGSNRPNEIWVFLCDANDLISANASFAPGVVNASRPMYPVSGWHIGLLALLTAGIVIGSVAVFMAADRVVSRAPRRRRAGTGSAPPPE
jgi:hypothetical protein